MLYFASDHAGYELKSQILELLNQSLEFEKVEFVDLTPDLVEGDDYPDVAKLLAEKLNEVGNDTSDKTFGVAICGSGQGICMAMNRFPWIRAGVGYDLESAEMMRRHNQANVLCLSGKKVPPELAVEMLLKFLRTEPDLAERHARRVKKLGDLGIINNE